jgi:hypothetical protein
MKTFKSVIMVKYPKEEVWRAMRDRLPEMTPYLDDVAAITQEERKEQADGSLKLINVWKADIKIPSLFQSVIDPSTLSWTDRAEWFEKESRCRWTIEPHFFTDCIRCAGTTRFEPAIGGRGTRITFEGEMEILTKKIAGLPPFMEATAAKTVESLVISLIPKNFRKIIDALSVLLKEKHPAKPAGACGAKFARKT